MIKARVVEEEKKVYVDVNGFITNKDARNFLNEYKQMTRGLKSSQYKLVVTPGVFECENNDDIRHVCMSFFKTGYKKIYLVDPQNYIMNNMKLQSMEKKMFNKAVKVVGSASEIK